jgi:hypothetical protein
MIENYSTATIPLKLALVDVSLIINSLIHGPMHSHNSSPKIHIEADYKLRKRQH